MILGELCMGGMVLETNMADILTHVEEQNKLEKSEVSVCVCRVPGAAPKVLVVVWWWWWSLPPSPTLLALTPSVLHVSGALYFSRALYGRHGTRNQYERDISTH